MTTNQKVAGSSQYCRARHTATAHRPSPTAQEIGSYDVLGKAISKDQAASLLQTPEGREQLSPDTILL